MGSGETSYPFRHHQNATQASRPSFPSGTSRRPSETWIALVSLLGIGLHLLLRFGLSVSSNLTLAPLWFVLLVGGVP
jgi:hypothetical protein